MDEKASAQSKAGIWDQGAMANHAETIVPGI